MCPQVDRMACWSGLTDLPQPEQGTSASSSCERRRIPWDQKQQQNLLQRPCQCWTLWPGQATASSTNEFTHR